MAFSEFTLESALGTLGLSVRESGGWRGSFYGYPETSPNSITAVFTWTTSRASWARFPPSFARWKVLT